MKYFEHRSLFSRAILILLSSSAIAVFSSSSHAQESVSLGDERTKQLQQLGLLLPDPAAIRASAEFEFAKPAADQDAERLEDIANEANTYSNLVTKITDEYNDYLRDNSRYDFVIEEVKKAPIVASLLSLDSEFKGIRNQAYLNLGVLALNDGRKMEAFLLFNDAFRLSVFDCADGADSCLRHQAEQHMKELLGVDGESYVHWKK
ncbi:hypothetical protein ACGYLX_10260 [Sulfitobacter sp. 1A13496]|uniref:hypothetical protein n=1 Tax=Sulfitobacter sp. 1A13496 TaxID=3368596 RepID=UPI003745CC53